MTNNPAVTILVPVFKVEQWIEKCARSAFEQTYENLEYIFVDDCSPDNSIEILQIVITDYPHRAPRVRIIHHEHNRGLAGSRNTLVDACQTEFLFHLDSDDWMEPNAIELLVKKQLETGADIVTGRVLDCTRDGVIPYKSLGHDMDRDSALLALLDNQRISPILFCRLFRTSLYKQHGVRWQEKVDFNEDLSVTPRLFYYAKTVAGITEFIHDYNRLNLNSYTNKFETDWSYQLQALKAYEINVSFFSDKETKYKEVLELTVFKKYRYVLFLTAMNNNKDGFNYCKRYLQENRHCYSKIHKGKASQLIDNSYFLMRSTYKLRLLRSKLLAKSK